MSIRSIFLFGYIWALVLVPHWGTQPAAFNWFIYLCVLMHCNLELTYSENRLGKAFDISWLILHLYSGLL